jgi:hypothetical protein
MIILWKIFRNTVNGQPHVHVNYMNILATGNLRDPRQ